MMSWTTSRARLRSGNLAAPTYSWGSRRVQCVPFSTRCLRPSNTRKLALVLGGHSEEGQQCASSERCHAVTQSVLAPFLFGWPLDTQMQQPVVDEQLIDVSGKMMVLERLLDAPFERGHKVLVFSQFHAQCDQGKRSYPHYASLVHGRWE